MLKKTLLFLSIVALLLPAASLVAEDSNLVEVVKIRRLICRFLDIFPTNFAIQR